MDIINLFQSDWANCAECGKKTLTKKQVTIDLEKLNLVYLSDRLAGDGFCSWDCAEKKFEAEFRDKHGCGTDEITPRELDLRYRTGE